MEADYESEDEKVVSDSTTAATSARTKTKTAKRKLEKRSNDEEIKN